MCDVICQVRSGMVAVSDGKTRPRAMRLHLSMEVLRLQSQEDQPTASESAMSPPGSVSSSRRRTSELLTPACTSPGATSTASQQPPEDGRLPPPDARVCLPFFYYTSNLVQLKFS